MSQMKILSKRMHLACNSADGMRPCGLPAHVLLVFVDGLGLPVGKDLDDTIYSHCPVLRRLFVNASVPLDARLGVPGVPQSATGQTTIVTGVNAAAHIGRHLEGFPNRVLRQVIEQENVFVKLLERGRTCTFANAYARCPGGELPMARRAVTTVSTLAAFGKTRDRDALLDGRAVYHDLTREALPNMGVTGIPVITERDAAAHMLGILRTVHFCLFEYFLTDRVGHRGTLPEKKAVLASLDTLLGHLLEGLDLSSELLLLVSDHGNIEACDRRGHSQNPVPWIAYGYGSEQALQGCTSLLDVTPKILELVCSGKIA